MRVWWDLVSEDGYGYNWGRSQGVVSYLDTPEIVGFLATHSQFRPAPLADIAALYYQAWKYLRHDYRDDTHLLSIFAFGRGNYAYITREREWQQTTGFFGKLAGNHHALMLALEKEGLTTFPSVPTLPEVARFSSFARVNVHPEFGLFGRGFKFARNHDWSKTRSRGLLARTLWPCRFCITG
jgi:hypothetical protein